MQRIILVVSLFLILTFCLTGDLYAPKEVTCPCDVDAFDNCIPCEKQKETAPPVKDERAVPEVVCPCDVDAGGKCLPCEYDSEKRSYMGSDPSKNSTP